MFSKRVDRVVGVEPAARWHDVHGPTPDRLGLPTPLCLAVNSGTPSSKANHADRLRPEPFGEPCETFETCAIFSLVEFVGASGGARMQEALISLMQMAIAGVGAFGVGSFGTAAGLPMLIAMPLALACGVAFGLVAALPSLRTRGASLAVVTLASGLAI